MVLRYVFFYQYLIVNLVVFFPPGFLLWVFLGLVVHDPDYFYLFMLYVFPLDKIFNNMHFKHYRNKDQSLS